MLPVSGKGRITINDICGKFVGPGEEGGKYTIDCDHELWADYITIQILDDSAILSLNEIRIDTAKYGML